MNKYQNLQENDIETIKITLNENLPSPTMIQNKKINSFGNHKAILGYLNAYFNHCPIKLSPNLLWQLILNIKIIFQNMLMIIQKVYEKNLLISKIKKI